MMLKSINVKEGEIYTNNFGVNDILTSEMFCPKLLLSSLGQMKTYNINPIKRDSHYN